MQVIRDYRDCPQQAKGAVLAIGNFDGVHRGHQVVIQDVLETADAKGKPAAVMCFEPHPRRFFNPDLPEDRITSFAAKARLLRHKGIEIIFAQRFTKGFSNLDAEVFVEQVLVGQLAVSHVIVGYDFIFGYRRSGNAEILQQAGSDYGFAVTIVDALKTGQEACASSSIRRFLRAGEVAKAADMLGRDYTICGTVRRGEQRGRTIGFPTANIFPPCSLLPRFGVYAVSAEIDGKTWYGVANFGIKPTFGDHRPCLEVHFFHIDANLYDRELTITLQGFIRPEQRFDGVEALKAQIANDCRQAMAFSEVAGKEAHVHGC